MSDKKYQKAVNYYLANIDFGNTLLENIGKYNTWKDIYIYLNKIVKEKGLFCIEVKEIENIEGFEEFENIRDKEIRETKEFEQIVVLV